MPWIPLRDLKYSINIMTLDTQKSNMHIYVTTIPGNFKGAKIIDFTMPRHEVIQKEIEQIIVVVTAFQL